MGFLKMLRAIVVVAIVVVAIGFAVLNPGERVRVDLFFAPPWESVPLVLVLFVAFLAGGIGGLSVALLWVVELQAKVRAAKRAGRRLEGELTSLRNLPLEEESAEGAER